MDVFHVSIHTYMYIYLDAYLMHEAMCSTRLIDVLGSYESTPCRRVLATAMRAPLSLSPSTFSFSFPVGYLETMTEPALHSQVCMDKTFNWNKFSLMKTLLVQKKVSWLLLSGGAHTDYRIWMSKMVLCVCKHLHYVHTYIMAKQECN